MAQARFDMPERVRAGEVFKLRLLVQHPMETGYLLDLNNQRIARNVINDMRCTYLGQEVFRIEPSSGLSANPYVEFFFARHSKRRNCHRMGGRPWPARPGQAHAHRGLINFLPYG